MGVVTFFVLKVTDYESAMLIYFFIYIKEVMIQVAVLIRFHEIHMVGAGPLMGEPYCFWK